MKIKIALLVGLVCHQLTAAAQDHAIGGKVGLLGIGAEYTYNLTERLAIRGMLFGSGYSFDATESGIDYSFDLDWDSLAVAVDLHPARGPFRLTAGLMRNGNGLSARSTPSEDLQIGDTVYSPSEIGSLTADIGFDGTSAFVGVGWDWSRSKRVGFALDLGLVEQGSPVVSLRASGSLLGDPAFAADIAAEEAELRTAMDDLNVLPFASIGLIFRF